MGLCLLAAERAHFWALFTGSHQRRGCASKQPGPPLPFSLHKEISNHSPSIAAGRA